MHWMRTSIARVNEVVEFWRLDLILDARPGPAVIAIEYYRDGADQVGDNFNFA